VTERLRLWLERSHGGRGFHLRDAATGEHVRWEDRRIRVVAVAGVSFRAEAVEDASFDPGRALTLVREPENEHDPNAVGIWNAGRTVQAGYVPRETAPELGRMLAVVGALYVKDLIGVTDLIHSRTGRKAQQFADAFKFRKDS